MGSHSKKHKKNRHRSRSRSPSSENRRHKSRRKSRSRSVSRSSSDSSQNDRRRRVKKHRRRSQSRSRSHSRSRSRRSRSRSRSRDRDRHSSGKHRRRSRSRSTSRSRRRSRTRSRTPSRSRRRSRSRSQSPEYSSPSGSHSRHDSKEKIRSKDAQGDKHAMNMMPAETVKHKMQKALEAAASANVKLKEKGATSGTIKQEPLSLAEEHEKQRAIAEIEDDSFKPSTFLSAQSITRPLPTPLNKEQNHDNAIFGSAAVAGLNQASFKRNQTIFYKTVNRGELASSLLAKTSEEKMEAWMAKLTRMRREKIQGNPEYFKKLLNISTVAKDSWDRD